MAAQAKAEVFDVAISGGGVAGSTLASLLGLQGFNVCLISGEPQRAWNPQVCHPRVNAINHASIRIFKHLGIWSDIRNKRVNPYYLMEVWEKEAGGGIRFDAKELRVPHLGSIIENTAITSSLFEFLRQQPTVSIIESARLQEITVKEDRLGLTADSGRNLQCRLLVGADGAHSITRNLSNIDCSEYETGQQAIVAELVSDGSDSHTAWQVFLPTGPVALLPLKDGKYSLVWSCDNDCFQEVAALDDEAFCEALTEHFQGRPGKIAQTGKRYSFVLRQHQAESYIANRVALIGDAAHSIHPLAGLGANMGLLDAASLSQVLGEMRQCGRDFDAYSVLRRYERWRKGDNALVLNCMRGLKALFGNDMPGSRAVGGLGLKLVNRLPPIKSMLAGFAMGNIGDLPLICAASRNADI